MDTTHQFRGSVTATSWHVLDVWGRDSGATLTVGPGGAVTLCGGTGSGRNTTVQWPGLPAGLLARAQELATECQLRMTNNTNWGRNWYSDSWEEYKGTPLWEQIKELTERLAAVPAMASIEGPVGGGTFFGEWLGSDYHGLAAAVAARLRQYEAEEAWQAEAAKVRPADRPASPADVVAHHSRWRNWPRLLAEARLAVACRVW